jgi:biopolymer transport protein ExbD
MPISKARLKISDYNETRKIRLRSQERRVGMVALSLTSMVDMFAILVIFLLANSSTLADWVKVGHNINLPHAKSSDLPQKAATVQIAADNLYGEDKALQPTEQIWKNTEPFRRWLKTLDKKDGYINIVGHEKIAFGLVKRIVAACQDAGFHKVNLAVQPRVVKAVAP